MARTTTERRCGPVEVVATAGQETLAAHLERVKHAAEQLAQEVDEKQEKIVAGEQAVAELPGSLRQLELREQELQRMAGTSRETASHR